MKSDRLNAGLKVRREVLGAEYVDRAFALADGDTTFIQEFVTEVAWGTVWARSGLDRRSRSLLNLGMLTALNRPHELEIHIKAALTNGISRTEIFEAFLHTAIYCGVPAALDSVRIAKQVFAALDENDVASAGSQPTNR